MDGGRFTIDQCMGTWALLVLGRRLFYSWSEYRNSGAISSRLLYGRHATIVVRQRLVLRALFLGGVCRLRTVFGC